MSKYNPDFAEGEKKQVTFYIKKDVYLRFQKMYPNISTMFFNRVVRLALQDKEFVKNVIFSDVEY